MEVAFGKVNEMKKWVGYSVSQGLNLEHGDGGAFNKGNISKGRVMSREADGMGPGLGPATMVPFLGLKC